MFEAEAEEETLNKTNKALKARVRDMEGEVATLKKLLVELGLVKKSNKKAR